MDIGNNRYFYGSSRGGIERTKKKTGSLSFVIEPAIIGVQVHKILGKSDGEAKSD
jgi:hypothetical protein